MHRALLLVFALLAGCELFAHPAPAPQLAHPVTPVEPADTESIGVTWIGHATALVRIRDHWFLTDPVLSDRIALIYPRLVEPGIALADLPHLDAVLVSHSHTDHLDPATLRELAPTPVIVPPGSARYLPHDSSPVVKLDTWQSWHHGDVTITAVPAKHPDSRWDLDFWVHRGHTGYVIQVGDLTVYFAGDTALDLDQSRAIAARFHIDVALIPVGPAAPKHWPRRSDPHVHVSPDQAMQLFAAVGAQWMVPIHYGTFTADLAHERPIVLRAIARSPLASRVRVLDIGETTEFLY